MNIKDKTVFSGITPSSAKGLHLGNYFGAVKHHVGLQEKAKNATYFVANIHALNTITNPKEVEQNTLSVFLEWIALGIDPNKSLFFVQSDIPAIPYIQTVLNNVVTIAELKRMHGYKDKLQNQNVDPDTIGMGLFSYPVLMAADILTFKPDLIPVGEDQTQHVEITRDIAKSFNNRYGNVFILPQIMINKQGARVKGIDGERKMSKSIGNDIPIFGDESFIEKQIMKITTDPNRIHANDPGDPNKNVAFEYLELLDYDSNDLEKMKDAYRSGTIKDVLIKEKLFGTFMEYFKDVRAKKQELESNLDYIHEIRAIGAHKANAIAEATLVKVKRAVGFKTKSVEFAKKPNATFDDFVKLDIRIGTIKVAEQHPNADKLLRLELDFGEETRQILAGIAETYPDPTVLIGKQIPVVFNLEPRKIRGLESQGMIMATDNDAGIVLLHPEEEVAAGSLVR